MEKEKEKHQLRVVFLKQLFYDYYQNPWKIPLKKFIFKSLNIFCGSDLTNTTTNLLKSLRTIPVWFICSKISKTGLKFWILLKKYLL